MQIDLLKRINFRAFSELEIEFSSGFNILVGDNMTGKTSILEALSIAMASFFWELMVWIQDTFKKRILVHTTIHGQIV